MISHKYKVIFIHIPKVAGQSIETFFLELHGLDWQNRAPLLLGPNDNPEIGPPRLAHLRAVDYCKYHYISPDCFNDYFKFSFIRNPWSRTVSFYRYTKYSRIVAFEYFVKKVLPDLIKEQNWFYGSQYDFVYDENRLMIDFLGRYESLDEDFEKLCKRLDIENEGLPHINKSSRETKNEVKKMVSKFKRKLHRIMRYGKDEVNSSDYKDYYDRDLIRLVEEIYHKDIEAFEYNF